MLELDDKVARKLMKMLIMKTLIMIIFNDDGDYIQNHHSQNMELKQDSTTLLSYSFYKISWENLDAGSRMLAQARSKKLRSAKSEKLFLYFTKVLPAPNSKGQRKSPAKSPSS